MIAGPTGVGKTAVAVALSRAVPLEVVSADSRQVYRGVDAATGKPSAAERRAVPHHVIDLADPWEPYQAARYRQDALAAIDRVRAAGRLPVVVGGTGLYIRALLRGLDPAAPRDPDFRAELELVARAQGSPALHAQLAAVAPAAAQRLHPNDRLRLVRARELHRAGFPTPAEHVGWQRRDVPYHLLYVGLTRERPRLFSDLQARAARMAADGLETEVRALLDRVDSTVPALQGIGYRQFVDVVRGRLTRVEAIRLMQRDTVRYAKRQWTWFSAEPDLRWLDVDEAGGIAGAAGRIQSMLQEEGVTS